MKTYMASRYVRVRCEDGAAHRTSIVYVGRDGQETDISDCVERAEVDLTVGGVVRAKLHVFAKAEEIAVLLADVKPAEPRETVIRAAGVEVTIRGNVDDDVANRIRASLIRDAR